MLFFLSLISFKKWFLYRNDSFDEVQSIAINLTCTRYILTDFIRYMLFHYNSVHQDNPCYN